MPPKTLESMGLQITGVVSIDDFKRRWGLGQPLFDYLEKQGLSRAVLRQDQS